MTPGRELDALIAEKVFGWKLEEHCGLKRMVWKGPPDYDVTWLENPPAYSTSIADAWLVVEKLRELGFYYCVGNLLSEPVMGITESNTAGFGRRSDLFETVAGESAAHAICLAALSTIGEK